MNGERLKNFVLELIKIIGFILTFLGLFLFLGRFLNLFPDTRIGYQVIMSICIFITTFVFTRLIENRSFLSIGLNVTESTFGEISYGFLMSFGMISFIFIIEASFGLIKITFKEISLLSISYTFLQGIVLYFFVALSEELLFRGYIFQSLGKASSNAWAISIMSLFFGMMHYFNPNFSIAALINIIFAGIWFGVAYLKTGSLWMPITMHFTWNFFQGVIYALPVSGLKGNTAFFITHENKLNWITGGSFGPEGGLLTSLLLILSIQFICTSKKLKPFRRVWFA
jgi:uncharacterized protein